MNTPYSRSTVKSRKWVAQEMLGLADEAAHQRMQISFAVGDAQDMHIPASHRVNDDIRSHRVRAPPSPQILIAGAPEVRKTGQKMKPFDKDIDLPVRDGLKAALSPQVKPNGFKVAFGVFGKDMQEIDAPLGLPLRRIRASASFNIRGKVAQRFAGDGPTSPLGDAFLGGVKGGAKSGEIGALFRPSRQRFDNHVVDAPPGLRRQHGDMGFLIGGKAYFHGESLTPRPDLSSDGPARTPPYSLSTVKSRKWVAQEMHGS